MAVNGLPNVLHLDSTQVGFLALSAPEARVDQAGRAVVDKQTGLPLFRVQIALLHPNEPAGLVSVTVAGQPEGIAPATPVTLTRFTGRPWIGDQGNWGIAFRAETLAPLDGETRRRHSSPSSGAA
ncbi:hypothetical protein CryarDRAFT_1338 [Cryptosporangium arvum DSM 44712]|uniref:Uncharacterized protein n=1 Tax=Cryptosporangium arvum DSM 44712 TaxID=927661 RepID=A0A010ZSU5_9ACTN|nr:hypothetical protein CryarDRAFT_1338 [Cryptosporangium arvum DSM 44712]